MGYLHGRVLAMQKKASEECLFLLLFKKKKEMNEKKRVGEEKCFPKKHLCCYFIDKFSLCFKMC